jgi:hypothetical protein
MAREGEEKMNVEQAAKVCHEANRAYCETIGDSSQPRWEDAPAWQKSSAIDGVHFHLAALARGEKPNPEASHLNWLKEKTAEGWKYGIVKSPERKEHPCFLPYNQLPLELRAKDYIFCAVVEALYNASPRSAAA